jgi:diguanylate cyclase (GGDEF)-like protein
MAACCVALGSECVEILLTPEGATDIAALAEHASEWLGIDVPAVAQVMGKIVAEIPEIERLFDTKLLQPGAANVILDQARDLLIVRNLQAPGEAGSLQQTNVKREAGATAPQDAQLRDGLTGLYNRGYLDLMLRREFQAATKGNWPLSVVFVDLDRFNGVNETYGREAGDSVLLSTAKSIASVARDTDCVARHGGEEFVIVLPGLESRGAEIFCKRLITHLRKTLHPIGGTMVAVTASVGLATHTPKTPFLRASHLINAAVRSVYIAKKTGRDRLVRHNPGAPVSAANR